MMIVDLMFAFASKAIERFHFLLRVPDFNRVGKDADLNLLANQSTVNGVSVVLHANQNYLD